MPTACSSSTVAIEESVIERCPGWRVIGRYGVGVDNVDVAAASRRGIAVINVPDYCVEEVATHTAAVALALVRRVLRSRELIDDGRWGAWSDLRPVERLSTCTLGLVGVGRIGAEVARLLGPFFDRVIAHDVGFLPDRGPDGLARRSVLGSRRGVPSLPTHRRDRQPGRSEPSGLDETDGISHQRLPRRPRRHCGPRRGAPRGSDRRRCARRAPASSRPTLPIRFSPHPTSC